MKNYYSNRKFHTDGPDLIPLICMLRVLRDLQLSDYNVLYDGTILTWSLNE